MSIDVTLKISITHLPHYVQVLGELERVDVLHDIGTGDLLGGDDLLVKVSLYFLRLLLQRVFPDHDLHPCLEIEHDVEH